ncbi:Hemerythrin HHE cation binding domain-containing protein [Devosia enhydra]|uniref:Hemerythrin HHE cation binding domain-containing protein n=1 Tax=Devosia enhydra TaxID=665118 RepID=A0A1K2I2G8_9HYPH|nr:hemerythrin domain-containing protein [Devosia enhydra]SFZ86586.1 Hemerythrin HHE cation binding domain-containing protein [Devosia enhydra]
MPSLAILMEFQTCQSDQLALCDELEAIADGLPDAVDREACLQAARAVLNVLSRSRAFEEDRLFPTLTTLGAAGTRDGLDETLEHLRFEHLSDACFAEEVYEALMSLGRGAPTLPPSAAGYMLRGFFEGLRRHLTFEKAFVLPLLSQWNGPTRH